jgi:uncharacterized protein YndB with AHSA1/START domain
MPTVRRSRTVAAPPGRVFRIVGDPHHLPRWWPRVSRVEGADARGFTQVLMTKKGRPVRADFRMVAVEHPSRCAWAQQVEGTPFEGFLASAETDVAIEQAGDGASKVTITARQKLRGLARFGGGLMLRRATRKQLDDALDGLEALL